MAKIEKQATNMHHIFAIDWDGNGLLREYAVVMEADDGTLYGIDVEKLHPIDKSRLKKFITSVHADKYPLWELMSQYTLNNGMNALDFFHKNYVKVKRPRGSILGGGLAAVQVSADNGKMIGSETSNPRGGVTVSDSELAAASRFA